MGCLMTNRLEFWAPRKLRDQYADTPIYRGTRIGNNQSEFWSEGSRTIGLYIFMLGSVADLQMTKFILKFQLLEVSTYYSKWCNKFLMSRKNISSLIMCFFLGPVCNGSVERP